MSTETAQISLPGGFALNGKAATAARFAWHYVQMILAMEIGMMAYHMLLGPLLERTPYGAFTDAYPIIGYWSMVVSMVLGMLALMLYHRSTARYCAEMSGAMIAPVALLTVLVICSVAPGHILYAAGDPLMFVAMAAYMLYRPHDHAHQHPDHGQADRTRAVTNLADGDHCHEQA